MENIIIIFNKLWIICIEYILIVYTISTRGFIMAGENCKTKIASFLNIIAPLSIILAAVLGYGVLKNQVEKVFAEIKENITKDWMKVADYLESLKMDEEQYKEVNVKPVATKRLQWELILHKLSELEKIEVSEEDLKKEIDEIIAKFWSEDVVKRLKELYIPGTKYYEELRQRVWYRKLIDSFFTEETK